jgi:hypothetical protein
LRERIEKSRERGVSREEKKRKKRESGALGILEDSGRIWRIREEKEEK